MTSPLRGARAATSRNRLLRTSSTSLPGSSGLNAPLAIAPAAVEPVNVLAAGPPIGGDRQLEHAAPPFDGNHALHRSLAIGSLADDVARW